MKSLVTGGAGFIGSHLTKSLVDLGHDVVVLDNLKRGNKIDKDILEQIQLFPCDIRNADSVMMAAKDCDYIFHFAAVLGVDIVADNPVETMETEVIGMQNVVKSAIQHKCSKIIYASTSGVYGKTAIQNAVNEEFDGSPKSSYSISKRYNEIYLRSLFDERNLQSSSLRFFNVYGPKQDNRMVIPRFFEQALHNKPVTVYGSGKQTRDFTYIEDVIESIIRVADRVPGCEIINISNNCENTINSLAKEIIELTGSKSNIQYVLPSENRYDFEVERRFGSSKKLQRLVGFCPNTPFKEGLKETYRWILKNYQKD